MNPKLPCLGILLASAMACTPPLLAQDTSGQLLKNAGFSGAAGSIPDSWQAYPPPSGENQKMGVDPAGGIRVTDQDAGNGLGIAQWLPVTPGTKYSAKLNVTGEGSIGLVLIFVPKIPAKAAMINKVALREATGYFSAGKSEPVVATVPDGATQMRVFVYSSKPGKCDLVVKSVELKVADAATPDSKGIVNKAPAAPADPNAPKPPGTGELAIDAAGKPAGKVLQNAPDMLQAGQTYAIDFESGDYSQVHMIEGGKKLIVQAPEPVRNGKYAMKVMMTHDQHRTEVTGPRSQPYGEYKYGWSLFLPETFDATTFFSIVTQWHTWGSGKDYPPDGGPPTSITIAGGKWNIKIQHQDGAEFKTAKQYIPFGDVSADKGKWTDFYMEVNWQSPQTGGGYLRLFKNGVKVVDYNGPTWFDGKTKGPFFKFGIYKGGAGWRGEESGAILYCDEFRIGDKSATREQIDPAAQPKK